MGYTTDFNGELELSKELTNEQHAFIMAFSNTRRMGRDTKVLMEKFKGKHGLPYTFKPTQEQSDLIAKLEATNLIVDVKPKTDTRTAEEIYGPNGEYFVGDEKTAIIDGNTPPGQITGFSSYDTNQERIKGKKCQPGLWCQWTIRDGKFTWDGGEKFYYYVEWLEYMIDHFFNPWGVLLNGTIDWSGEESSDIGKIVVTNNVVEVFEVEMKLVPKK
jgi:hypothetical protein